MSKITPKNGQADKRFPAQDLWEDLRRGWEAEARSVDPDPNVSNRNETLRVTARVTGVSLPQGLIVDIEQVRDVLQPLELEDDAFLAQRLFETAGRYLRPRQQAYFGTSAQQTKVKLKQLLKAALHLDELLDQTTVEVFGFIEQAHEALESAHMREPTMKVHQLWMALTPLLDAVSWLEQSIEIEPSRPPKGMRIEALVAAAQAIEHATCKPIERSWAKAGTPAVNAFKGLSGKVLLSFMRLLVPNASEAALVKDLSAARKELARAKSSRKSDPDD